MNYLYAFHKVLGFFVWLFIFHAMKLRNNWEVSQEVFLFPFLFLFFLKQYFITVIVFSFQCKHLIFREISLIFYLCKYISNYRLNVILYYHIAAKSRWYLGNWKVYLFCWSDHSLLPQISCKTPTIPQLQLASPWNQNSSINYISRCSNAY